MNKKEHIIKLYTQGEKGYQIAKKVGASLVYVYNVIKIYNLENK